MAFEVFNVTLSVSRAAAGSYDANGVFIPGATSIFTIRASRQPSTPTQLQRLPEGSREGGAYTLRTKDDLQLGDIVTIDDSPYQVMHVAPWSHRILPHKECIAVHAQQEGVL